MFLCFTLGLLLTTICLVAAQESPLNDFLSRPDIKSPKFEFYVCTKALVAPGYIFITPNSPSTVGNFQRAPLIYDNYGELIWSGYELIPPGLQAFDEQVCDYNGSSHICFTQFTGPYAGGPGGVGSSHSIIDNTYTLVRSITPNGEFADQELRTDTHELNLIGSSGNQSVLVTSYITYEHDSQVPPQCAGAATVPYLKTCFFQELSVDGKNTPIFTWNAIDWVPTTESKVCPGEDPTTGGGQSFGDGYDYFHINSIDKDSDGNYLVSGRHVSSLFKIAGLNHQSPGSIIWKLTGEGPSQFHSSSVVSEVANLNFSFQHHARFDNSLTGIQLPEVIGITFWDNANSETNNADSTAVSSSAKSVLINKSNYTATLVEQFVSPGRQLDSSQGSHQVLENGNHFLGLGSVNYVAEYTDDGVEVFYASFGVDSMSSYRAFRYEWSGEPVTSPDCFVYAKQCHSSVNFYVSWNGATEVRYWDFYVSNEKNSDFVHAGRKERTGFETHFESLPGKYAFAVALDKSGDPLGQTNITAVFVPSEGTVSQCYEDRCCAGYDYCPGNKQKCHRHEPSYSLGPPPSYTPTTESTSCQSSTTPGFSTTLDGSSASKTATTSEISTSIGISSTVNVSTTQRLSTSLKLSATTARTTTTHKRASSSIASTTRKGTTHRVSTTTQASSTAKISSTRKSSTPLTRSEKSRVSTKTKKSTTRRASTTMGASISPKISSTARRSTSMGVSTTPKTSKSARTSLSASRSITSRPSRRSTTTGSKSHTKSHTSHARTPPSTTKLPTRTRSSSPKSTKPVLSSTQPTKPFTTSRLSGSVTSSNHRNGTITSRTTTSDPHKTSTQCGPGIPLQNYPEYEVYPIATSSEIASCSAGGTYGGSAPSTTPPEGSTLAQSTESSPSPSKRSVVDSSSEYSASSLEISAASYTTAIVSTSLPSYPAAGSPPGVYRRSSASSTTTVPRASKTHAGYPVVINDAGIKKLPFSALLLGLILVCLLNL